MKVLELFAGTRSIGRAFENRGHQVYSVEWNRDFRDIDLYEDIGTLTADTILENFGRPDVVWASPDCTTFSVAAISHHRRRNQENGSLEPITDYAKFCDKVDRHVLDLIRELGPKYWFIENPRGAMRKMDWMGGASPVHGHLLPVWGRKPEDEAYGHLDEPSGTELQAGLQERRPMPRERSEGEQDGNPGDCRKQGPVKDSGTALRAHRGHLRGLMVDIRRKYGNI